MIDSAAWPTLDMSKKSMIGALLAAIVLATTLVATPVPLVNDVSEASAHTQTRCFQETVSVPVYGNPYSHVPTSYETRTQTTCVNEAHSHFWQTFAIGATAAVACGTFGVVATPAGGVACGVVMAAAMAA